MRKNRSAAAVTAIAVLLVACGGDARAGAGWEGTIQTLPDGAVLVSNPETGLWREGEGWRLTEDLRIGSLEGEGPDVFGQIRGLEVDAAGRIYVLDHQAHAVRVFDADGRYLHTLGREGAGPGEFRGAFGMRFDPTGRLWVADFGNARYSVFDTTGALLETHPRPIGSYGFLWNGGFDGDRLVEIAMVRDADGEGRTVLIRFDETLQPVDTLSLPTVPLRAEVYSLQDERGVNLMIAAVPFSPAMHQTLGSEGHLWWGASNQYRLHLSRLSGETVRIVERAYQPVPVTAAERDSALAGRFFQQMRERGARIDPGRVPPVKPAFEWFVIDDRDHLWVKLPNPAGEEGTRLDVFDPEGRYLGQVETAWHLSQVSVPVIRGGALYARVTDDLDVPYVVRLRIEGRG